MDISIKDLVCFNCRGDIENLFATTCKYCGVKIDPDKLITSDGRVRLQKPLIPYLLTSNVFSLVLKFFTNLDGKGHCQEENKTRNVRLYKRTLLDCFRNTRFYINPNDYDWIKVFDDSRYAVQVYLRTNRKNRLDVSQNPILPSDALQIAPWLKLSNDHSQFKVCKNCAELFEFSSLVCPNCKKSQLEKQSI